LETWKTLVGGVHRPPRQDSKRQSPDYLTFSTSCVLLLPLKIIVDQSSRSHDLKKSIVCHGMWYVNILQDHRYLDPPFTFVQRRFPVKHWVNILIPNFVVTSVLTSIDVSLTSCRRTPDETDGDVGSVTQSIFVRFTSNFVYLHTLAPILERVISQFSLIFFFIQKFLLDGNLTKSLMGREMQRKKGLEDVEIQKFHTTMFISNNTEHIT
jgi:hypothetical protein